MAPCRCEFSSCNPYQLKVSKIRFLYQPRMKQLAHLCGRHFPTFVVCQDLWRVGPAELWNSEFLFAGITQLCLPALCFCCLSVIYSPTARLCVICCLIAIGDGEFTTLAMQLLILATTRDGGDPFPFSFNLVRGPAHHDVQYAFLGDTTFSLL